MTENAVKVGAAEQIDADQLSVQVATMESAINNTDRAIEVLKSSLQLLFLRRSIEFSYPKPIHL